MGEHGTAKASDATSGRGAELKVLLVEDSPADALLAKRELGQVPWADVRVAHVETLAAALEHLSRHLTDVVVTDLGLTDSRGLDTVRALAESHDVPVLVFSGWHESEVLFQAIENGADDYVQKALRRDSLSRALRATVARDRMRRSARVIVESCADAMVVFDEDGVVLFANPAAQLLFGASADSGATFPFAATDISAAEIELPRDGGARMAEMRVRTLDWDGRPCFLAAVRDITDRKRAEEYERQLAHADRLSSIGQLAAGAAHEINNPASFISANLQVLRAHLDALERAAVFGKRPDDELTLEELWAEAREMLEDCQVGVKRIASTVRDLSSFARIERDEVETIAVGDLVDVAVSMTRNEIRHRAELQTDVAADLAPVVGDRAKLSQVLVNLLLNAAQAMEGDNDEANRISVDGYADGDSVVIAVEDSGTGIAPHALRSVFEPFYTTKERGQGTGLGLAICAETIRKHGGEITVTSDLGRGARFEVRLPAKPGDAADTRRAFKRTSSPRSRLLTTPGRILIVDDERHLRMALRRLLRNFEVVECSEAEGALQLLESDRSFDIILCDLMMPGADGVDLYEALRISEPALLEKVIFMTGGAFTGRAKEFIANAARPVLEKPISQDDLIGAVTDVLRRASEGAE